MILHAYVLCGYTAWRNTANIYIYIYIYIYICIYNLNRFSSLAIIKTYLFHVCLYFKTEVVWQLAIRHRIGFLDWVQRDKSSHYKNRCLKYNSELNLIVSPKFRRSGECEETYSLTSLADQIWPRIIVSMKESSLMSSSFLDWFLRWEAGDIIADTLFCLIFFFALFLWHINHRWLFNVKFCFLYE